MMRNDRIPQATDSGLPPDLHPFLTRDAAVFGKPVCRLGLASRGESELAPDDVLAAIERGVNFLNWPAASEGPARPEGA